MAAVEERRTLLLQRLCEHQARLRPPTSRLLLPIEIDVGIANDQALKKNELDSRIQLMRSAAEKMEKAVEFWKWCETTLLLISSPSTQEEEEEEKREGEAAKEQADDQSDKKSPAPPDVDQVSLTSQRKIVEEKKAME
jgi:hypothetical protein